MTNVIKMVKECNSSRKIEGGGTTLGLELMCCVSNFWFLSKKAFRFGLVTF